MQRNILRNLRKTFSQAKKSNVENGKISQIIGAVVDVQFHGQLPALGHPAGPP